MRKAVWFLIVAVAFSGVGASATAEGDGKDGRDHVIRVKLRADNEVPVVISDAKGDFRAKVDVDAETIEYELSYSGLEGTITQAHIHAGQAFTAGGIMIWLCGNTPPTTPPAGTQPCPPAPATISGTITAADVIGPAGQAIPAGAFADALQAIRSGNAYVNVHSTSAPGGEVRGQIR